jgi:hypothetical protein
LLNLRGRLKKQISLKIKYANPKYVHLAILVEVCSDMFNEVESARPTFGFVVVKAVNLVITIIPRLLQQKRMKDNGR